MTSAAPTTRSDVLVTPRFAAVTGAAFFYFLAIGTGLAVIPRYVEDLGGSGVQVGLAAGALGITAALMRPAIGPLGDRLGRRFLFQFGCLTVGASILLLTVADSPNTVIAVRLLTGIGESGAFVGAASAAQDMAPAHRRAEAASYFSVAIYSGMAIGPQMGDWMAEHHGTDAVWILGAALAGAGALLGFTAPSDRIPAQPGRSRRFLHPAAVRPGLLLFCGLLGYMGFTSFIALQSDDVGLSRGVPFLVLALTVLALRIAASRVPDRLGPVRAATIAIGATAAGLATLFAWQAPAGIVVASVVLGVGQAFLMPALLAAAVEAAPDDERSHAIGTFSSFFDAAMAIGGLAMGAVVSLSDKPTAFLVGSLISLVTLTQIRRVLGPVISSRDDR